MLSAGGTLSLPYCKLSLPTSHETRPSEGLKTESVIFVFLQFHVVQKCFALWVNKI